MSAHPRKFSRYPVSFWGSASWCGCGFVEGLVCRGSASSPRCAPIGPLATPRDPRARLCPQAGRTDASPVRPARATPVIEACAAARFSPKADGRARCATAEARLRRRVLHGSAFRHVRRNHAARTASGGVWRRAAGKTCAQEPGRRKSVKAPQPSPEGFTLFLRAGPCPQADLPMAAASPYATPPAGIPASSRRESGAAPLATSPGRYSARVRGGRGRRRHREAQVRCRGAEAAPPPPAERVAAAEADQAACRPASRREAPADASWRGLGAEHAGRRSRQAAHGRRRAAKGAKGAPAAEGTPSAPSKWMQPEGRAPAAGLASAAGACGQWDAPFPRGVEAPLRAHGFRSATRTGKCNALRNPRN